MNKNFVGIFWILFFFVLWINDYLGLIPNKSVKFNEMGMFVSLICANIWFAKK